MDWVDMVLNSAGWILGGIVLLLVIFLGLSFYDFAVVQQDIAKSYSNTYDIGDVKVFLTAIDSNWHEFQESSTLRKTYEDCRDGKVSFAEIKKKKNSTTYIPIVIPIR